VYFRRGGTIGGLAKTISENKDKIKGVVAALPLTDAQKAKLDGAIDNPSSLLPPQATQLISQASATIDSVKSSLPPEALAVVNSIQKRAETAVKSKLGIAEDDTPPPAEEVKPAVLSVTITAEQMRVLQEHDAAAAAAKKSEAEPAPAPSI